MSALALRTRPLPIVEPRDAEIRLFRRGPRNLAELIDVAWAGLQAESPIACPVCDGRMEPRHSANGVVGGKCTSCGTELS